MIDNSDGSADSDNYDDSDDVRMFFEPANRAKLYSRGLAPLFRLGLREPATTRTLMGSL